MRINIKRDPEGRTSIVNLHLDDASFEFFFKEHYPRLCVYCKFRYGFDIQLAEDVISTSLARLWEVRQTLDADISPTSYLYKIIDNRCLNIIKHDKVKRRYLYHMFRSGHDDISQVSFENLDLKELRNAIDDAIAGLPEQMRKIFELSRNEGLKYTDIADRLNLSVKTVETQMSRALAKLRSGLSEYLTSYFIVTIFGWLLKN